MELSAAVNTSTSAFFEVYPLGIIRGSNPTTNHNPTGTGEDLNIPGTSSTEYETVFIKKYGLEDVGLIEIISIDLRLRGNVKGNGSIRWQLTGNGGSNWITVAEKSFNVAGFTLSRFLDVGTWLTSIDTGDDKLQIRLQALANVGTVDIQLRDSNVILFQYRQKATV